MLRRFGSHVRNQWIGTVALFLVLTGGTAMAVDGSLPGQNTVGSEDIIPGEVFNGDLAPNSVGTGKVIDEHLVGDDIKNGSLGTADVANGSLTGTDIANNTVNADDVFGLRGNDDIVDNSLTGADVDEGTLSGFGCANGLVKGYVRIIGASSMPTTPTSSSEWVEAPYNCSGGSVTVRRTGGGGPGTYEVMFNGVAPRVAQASPVTSWGGSTNSNAKNIAATNLNNPGEGVDVIVTNVDTGRERHGWFTIVVM